MEEIINKLEGVTKTSPTSKKFQLKSDSVLSKTIRENKRNMNVTVVQEGKRKSRSPGKNVRLV